MSPLSSFASGAPLGAVSNTTNVVFLTPYDHKGVVVSQLLVLVLSGHEWHIGHGRGWRFKLHFCFDIAPLYNIYGYFTLAEITTRLINAIYS